MAQSEKKAKKLKPLKIKCTDTECESNLHCFRRTRKVAGKTLAGPCRACSAELVDWTRMYLRDAADADHTFAMLRTEFIRHHFWHLEIDQKAVNHARRKGRVRMREAIRHRIEKYVGPAEPKRDGRQTPWTGNAIFYGQHATATCCRKCINQWHGIPFEHELSGAEIDYLSGLVWRFVEERLPDLTEEGEKVPAIRRRPGGD